ncbi:hypothetical protein [Acidiferrobacter thiooxydans]|jgi:hypothetical protein|nr:hypothetical protein [Gammaproteobacteria bacterium]
MSGVLGLEQGLEQKFRAGERRLMDAGVVVAGGEGAFVAGLFAKARERRILARPGRTPVLPAGPLLPRGRAMSSVL